MENEYVEQARHDARLFNVEEAAWYIGRGKSTIYRWIGSGDLPMFGGLIRPVDLESTLARMSQRMTRSDANLARTSTAIIDLDQSNVATVIGRLIDGLDLQGKDPDWSRLAIVCRPRGKSVEIDVSLGLGTRENDP